MLVCTMMSKDSGTRTCSKKPSGVRHTSILTMVVNNKKSSDWRDNRLFVAGAEFLMQNVRDPKRTNVPWWSQEMGRQSKSREVFSPSASI